MVAQGDASKLGSWTRIGWSLREFEEAMRRVSTAVGATQEQLKGLRRAIASQPYCVTGQDGVTRIRRPDIGGW